jgi:hypothetical protein
MKARTPSAFAKAIPILLLSLIGVFLLPTLRRGDPERECL